MTFCLFQGIHIRHGAGKVAVTIDSVGREAGKSNPVRITKLGSDNLKNVLDFFSYFAFNLVSGGTGFPTDEVYFIAEFLRFLPAASIAWSLLAMMTYWLLSSVRSGEFLERVSLSCLPILAWIYCADSFWRFIPDFKISQYLLCHLKGRIITHRRPGRNNRGVIDDACFSYRNIRQN